jgi:hypothetical protein
MPVLTGISIFCLTSKNNLLITNIFGGASGNEGLGLLSLSFDWQYIGISSLYLPLVTLSNAFIGYILCMSLFVGLYYGDVWKARSFPFLSQSLFSPTSNATSYAVYNQSAILDRTFELNSTKLALSGIPFFTATNASYLLTTNLGISATIVHILLWNFDAVRNAFQLPNISKIRSFISNPKWWFAKASATTSEKTKEDPDPHYQMMLAYDEVPAWWFHATLSFSMIFGLICIYALQSTLPWWGFLIACALSFLSTLFFGAMAAMIGFNVPITSVVQLIGGYLHPGKPVANMYFVLFGANAQAQALFLIANLKLGQYGKLSPKCKFWRYWNFFTASQTS